MFEAAFAQYDAEFVARDAGEVPMLVTVRQRPLCGPMLQLLSFFVLVLQ